MSQIISPIVKKVQKVFNHERYEELLDNPLSRIPFENTSFYFDPKIFYKCVQGIYNIVFSAMDINGLEGGDEGSGKTTDASQLGYAFYYIMCELNVLNKELGTWYSWNLENVMGYNLVDFMNKVHKYSDMPFRIFILDEAGGLQGERRWDELNFKFRDNIRKDRKRLMIRILNFPQIWEIVKDLTLGRVNMIRLCHITAGRKEMKKDKVSTIFIPRCEHTFSYSTKELIPKREIKMALNEMSKEKYTKELNKKYIYCVSKKTSFFTFNIAQYEQESKDKNKLLEEAKGITLTPNVSRILAEHLTASRLGLSQHIPDGLSGDELKEAEKQKRKAMSIYHLVKQCKKQIKA